MTSGHDAEPSRQYPPATTPEELDHLVEVIKDWAIGNGLAVRTPPAVISSEADPTRITAVPAPVTLFPTAFPRQAFLQGQKAQNAYNELYAAVSRDENFLADVVKQQVHRTTHLTGERAANSCRLGSLMATTLSVICGRSMRLSSQKDTPR